MSEQPKKSKKIIRILIVVLVLLFLVLIGAVVYFYLIGDTQKEDQSQAVNCGCYYIDPQVVNSCGDTKKAFLFNIAEGTLNNCSASCPLTDLSENMLYSTTERDSYLTCNIKTIPDVSCQSMIVRTPDEKIVTGKISPDEEIIVTALFDSSEYTDHTFLINNVPTTPDSVEGKEIKLNIKDLEDVTTLTIVAQAKNKTGDLVESIMCNRTIEVTSTAKAGVGNATFETYTSSENITKIKSVLILVGGLQDTENTKVEFSFSNSFPTITMTKGFEIDPSRGRILLTETEIYNTENFTDGKDFSVLSSVQGELQITTKVSQDDASLGSTTSTVNFLEEEPGKETPSEQEEPDETPYEEPSTGDPEIVESNFTVTKSGAPICVERVSPNDVAEFTITINNQSTQLDSIQEVKDKLPLGFSYVEGSSKINNMAIADSVFVTVTNVGSSQEIVWAPQTIWEIASNGSMTISFKANAGENALTGANLNEVIITPSEIPVDPATLRASFEITVAQDCDNVTVPQTGIFDSTIGRIVVGFLIIGTGIILYNGNQGSRLAKFIVDSPTYKGAEMTSYKIFNPKRYFEEKILSKSERVNRKR